MNSLIHRIAILSLTGCLAVWSAGCGKTTEKGGPGAAKTEDGKMANDKNTFSLTLPSTETAVKAGAEEKVTVKINRGEQFKQPVKLKFDLPEGITIAPESPTVAANKNEIELTITAKEKAAEGKRSVKVTGKPEDGKSVDGQFVVDIKKAS